METSNVPLLSSVVRSFVPVFLSAIPVALFGVMYPADPIPVIMALPPLAVAAIVGFYWRIRLAMS